MPPLSVLFFCTAGKGGRAFLGSHKNFTCEQGKAVLEWNYKKTGGRSSMELLEPVVWLLLGVAFAVAEGLTVQLVSIWFAIGAAVAAVAAAFTGLSVTGQFWLFLGVSAVLLAATRPLVKRGKRVPTNADRIIGQVGVVQEAIHNDLEQGRVKIDGLSWSARTVDSKPLEAGARVRVLRIEGAKVIVEPCSTPKQPEI